MTFNAKEVVIKTIGELGALRGEADEVWRTLYACIDLARSLDLARAAVEAEEWHRLDGYADAINGTLAAIITDLSLWQARESVARGTVPPSEPS